MKMAQEIGDPPGSGEALGPVAIAVRLHQPVTAVRPLQAVLAALVAVVAGLVFAAIAQVAMIALTFDDGPGPMTPQILDALRAHGVRATFFIIGIIVMAVLAFGEGYHNYHHSFPFDYRNGVKPWQFDPAKWIIWEVA